VHFDGKSVYAAGAFCQGLLKQRYFLHDFQELINFRTKLKKLGLAIFYHHSIEWLQAHMLTCWFKKIFHVDCPGCGFQRSVIDLMKGNFSASFHMYPATGLILFILSFTALHLKWNFRYGPDILKYSYIIAASVIIISYLIKLKSQHFF